MNIDNNNKTKDLISKTLFFSSLKDNEFDYTLPIKTSLFKFCREQRAEASPNLFEYLCYKIVEKKAKENKINEETAIISEKFLSSKNCKINIIKSNSIQKKFIFIPIRHSITHKWNAIIFVHLERQIMQYMNKSNDEPIVAKIISSNINSEEDDYILNTTMDKIENSFNFTSPEDIQFEVDSINISDQPNTSIFLLNFIEGLISQENNTESIMNYIMKLYDESSNTNIIGSNNYFISFNRENEIFNDLIPNYQNELKNYIKDKNNINLDENSNFNGKNIFDFIQFEGEDEEDLDSEEEALKIIAKENEEARKQMEEQELFFANRINSNFNIDTMNNMPNKNALGLIQEVENESEDDSEQKSKLSNNVEVQNNNSLIKKEDIINLTNADNIENFDNGENEIEEEQNNDFKFDALKNNNELQQSITKGKLVDSDNENEKIKEKTVFNESKNIEKSSYKKEISNELENINLNNNTNQINNNKMIINKSIIEKQKDINSQKKFKESENIISNNKIKNKEISKDRGNGGYNKKNNININTKNINNQNTKDVISNAESFKNSNENIQNLNKNDAFEKMNVPNSMNKNIAAINNNIKNKKNKMINSFKNDIIKNNNMTSYRGSYNFNNNSKEKIKILNNDKKEEALSKSCNNINPDILEKTDGIEDSISFVNRSGNRFNNCQFYISNNTNIKINNKNIRYNNENDNIVNAQNYINPKTDKSNKNIYQKFENDLNINNQEVNFIENNNNNLIYDSNSNLKNESSKKIYKNSINNLNENKYKNINSLGEINSLKPALSLVKKDSPNINNIEGEDFGRYKKNTIIINETSNNNTVINFIEIKNNYDSNQINDINDDILDRNCRIKSNNYYNIKFPNNNNYIKNELYNPDDNDFFSYIPDDGTINSISKTFSPNKTFSMINNQEHLYKTIPNTSNSFIQFKENLLNDNNDIKSSLNEKSGLILEKEDDININNHNNTYKTSNTNKIKTFSDNNSKISKLTLLDNFLYGKEFLNSENNKNNNEPFNSLMGSNYEIHTDNIINNQNKKLENESINDNSNYNYNLEDENKNENNAVSNSNGNIILRRTTKKMRHRSGPEKKRTNSNNNDDIIDLMKDYESFDDCALNISKDLKCGCTGNLEEGCLIF